jgi:hypothetical protein
MTAWAVLAAMFVFLCLVFAAGEWAFDIVGVRRRWRAWRLDRWQAARLAAYEQAVADQEEEKRYVRAAAAAVQGEAWDHMVTEGLRLLEACANEERTDR